MVKYYYYTFIEQHFDSLNTVKEIVNGWGIMESDADGLFKLDKDLGEDNFMVSSFQEISKAQYDYFDKVMDAD